MMQYLRGIEGCILLTLNKPMISVIVPVFNVEKYLSRCIESILQQTYKNIEIILVDDGSSDKSGAICDDYANKYGNIASYHQRNQGQGAARNNGLDKCHGDYIGFVDSDDYIALDMYEYLYRLIVENRTDCASITFKYTTDDKEKLKNDNEQINVYENEDVLEKHLLEATTNTGAHSVCRCLFKAESLADVRFPTEMINEDIPFKFAALSHVKSMVNSNLIKYYYYQNSKSTTRGAFKDKDLDLFKATKMLMDMARPYNKKIQALAKAKHERGYFSILARIAFYGSLVTVERKDKIVGMCQKKLRDNLLFLLRMPIPISRKVLMILFSVNYRLTEIVIVIARRVITRAR